MKLNKGQQEQFDRLKASLEVAADLLNGAIDTFNGEMHEAWTKVERERDNVNDRIKALEAFRDQVHSDAQAEFDDHSEKWQEGDAGQALADFLDKWGDEL